MMQRHHCVMTDMRAHIAGLDSACALSVMRQLRSLVDGTWAVQSAARGADQPAPLIPPCGVLAALHQPRVATWAMLDMVSHCSNEPKPAGQLLG